MKIGFFEIQNWEKEYINSKLNGNEISFFVDPLKKENIHLAKEFNVISPFVYSKIDKEVISQLPNLKFISTRSTGFDHIDVELAKNQNILVSNVPNYGENTVAEHAFALILGLSRKIIDSVEVTKRGDFSPNGLTGFDLAGKTIGIVGMGSTGIHMARIANGFGMNVLAFDVKEDKKLEKKLNFKYIPFEDLLKNSDIISLHLPLNEKTKYLINKENINLIKKGAYLINTSRGEIVETSVLIYALDNKILNGVGLDVLEGECYVKEERQLLSQEFPKHCDLKTVLQNHILLQQKNVIITPHNAFNSKEALERILETTVENIQAFLKKKPINTI